VSPANAVTIRWQFDSNEWKDSMGSQRALFAEKNQEPPALEPPGFRDQERIMSEEEEVRLASDLGQLELKPFEFHGYLGNRWVINFGLKYDFSHRSIQPAGDMPAFLNDLLSRAASFAGCPVKTIRQVGVNQYRAGAGIGWHKDKPEFGVIVGVSLLAPATMRFRKPSGKGWVRTSHIVQPRSIYILSGEARTDWEHSIPPLGALRYSITFRTLSGLRNAADHPG
jgi:alkylated DNA repair dioxygenase AlkB